MAGDWMKIELELPGKPEVFQIAGALSLDPDLVVGKLVKVWGWFDKHTVDGNARGVTISAIDSIAGVTGFGSAMELAGWLSQSESGVILPRFDRHNGKTAKNRGLTAKRVAAHKAKGNDDGNATGVSGALPREEKRREEKKLLSPAPAADLVPHQAIVELYHRILPELAPVRVWNEQRQKLLRTRWKEDHERQTLEFWEKLFTYVRQCGFLMGKNNSNWQATLEWMLNSANFVKIIEGNYEDKA